MFLKKAFIGQSQLVLELIFSSKKLNLDALIKKSCEQVFLDHIKHSFFMNVKHAQGRGWG